MRLLRRFREWLDREPDYFRDPYVIPSAEVPNTFAAHHYSPEEREHIDRWLEERIAQIKPVQHERKQDGC